MKKPYLEAGEFVSTHGVAGELKLYPWSDEPGFLTGFTTIYLDENGRRALRLLGARVHKNCCLVRLEGVGTVEEARTLIGKTAWVARGDIRLPAGRHLVQDLIGARVEDEKTGRVYGTIAAVSRPGRHDVYEIIDEKGESHLFPAVAEFLAQADTEAGVVKVRPIEGMFSDAD